MGSWSIITSESGGALVALALIGSFAVSMGVVQDFGGLVTTRFLLGVAEGQKCWW